MQKDKNKKEPSLALRLHRRITLSHRLHLHTLVLGSLWYCLLSQSSLGHSSLRFQAWPLAVLCTSQGLSLHREPVGTYGRCKATEIYQSIFQSYPRSTEPPVETHRRYSRPLCLVYVHTRSSDMSSTTATVPQLPLA